MKHKIKSILLKNNRAEDIPMFTNYTHFQFKSFGIVLTSNKGIGLPKVFVSAKDVAFITW
jgi:hypothetical protein